MQHKIFEVCIRFFEYAEALNTYLGVVCLNECLLGLVS